MTERLNQPKTEGLPREILDLVLQKARKSGKSVTGPSWTTSGGLKPHEWWLTNHSTRNSKSRPEERSPAEMLVHLYRVLEKLRSEQLIEEFDFGLAFLQKGNGKELIENNVAVFVTGEEREKISAEIKKGEDKVEILSFSPVKKPIPPAQNQEGKKGTSGRVVPSAEDLTYESLIESLHLQITDGTIEDILGRLRKDQGLSFAQEVQKEIGEKDPFLAERMAQIEEDKETKFPFAASLGIMVLWETFNQESLKRGETLPPISSSAIDKLREEKEEGIGRLELALARAQSVLFLNPEDDWQGISKLFRGARRALNMYSLYDTMVWENKRFSEFSFGFGYYLLLLRYSSISRPTI